eukprot:358971-Chlamydomonas_euryale.AAC.1
MEKAKACCKREQAGKIWNACKSDVLLFQRGAPLVEHGTFSGMLYISNIMRPTRCCGLQEVMCRVFAGRGVAWQQRFGHWVIVAVFLSAGVGKSPPPSYRFGIFGPLLALLPLPTHIARATRS